MTAPPDRDLIQRARRGEADAFGELVTRYQTSVFNVCYRILYERGEAEDLAQEAFLRAYQRLDRFDLERPFGPWIRRVAANLCLNHLAARPVPAAELDEERDPDPGERPEAASEARQQAEEIRHALASLPPHYRAVVELRHYQDLSYDEIAAALGIPLSDVKSHLFRARRLLAEKIQHASL
jgi:RNA polymerase sigma-70 factor (ECF subfamily)